MQQRRIFMEIYRGGKATSFYIKILLVHPEEKAGVLYAEVVTEQDLFITFYQNIQKYLKI